jgi:hypothetical protein
MFRTGEGFGFSTFGVGALLRRGFRRDRLQPPRRAGVISGRLIRSDDEREKRREEKRRGGNHGSA